MDKEPTIEQIEKLINHFRDTNREHELFEVLAKHNIKSDEPVETVHEDTGEFHEEGLVFNKIAEKEGLYKRHSLINLIKKVRKDFREKWYLRYGVYYLVIFGLLFMVLNAPIILSRFIGPKEGNSRIITTQELQTVKMAESAPLDPGEVVPNGSQIVIPKIGVTAPVIFVSTRDEKTIQANLTNGVVHYEGTAKPGEVGNSFLTGHSSNFWWIKGNFNYIFVNLDKLQLGDQAKVYYNGKKFVYQVSAKRVVEPTDTTVLAATDTPTLTLMTCTPPGTNWKRLIISLDQIAPKYEKPKMLTRQIVVPNDLPSTDTNSTGGIFLGIWKFATSLFGLKN